MSYEVKGCLQKIKTKQFFPGTSPRKGQIVVLQLNCGHQIQRCAGYYIGKRIHCLTCISKNAINSVKLQRCNYETKNKTS